MQEKPKPAAISTANALVHKTTPTHPNDERSKFEDTKRSPEAPNRGRIIKTPAIAQRMKLRLKYFWIPYFERPVHPQSSIAN